MQFLDAVNRILRMEGIITGDDDALTTFSATQHVAAMNLAKIAVQDELSSLVSDDYLPYEQAEATITTTASTRTYSLAADFVRFADEDPFLLETTSGGVSENVFTLEYPGGENQLRRQILDYREQTGDAQWFYGLGGTSKTIGLYPVPESTKYYRYYYEKSVSVTNASDTVPLVTTEEANAFCQMASRRFKYLMLPSEDREKIFRGGILRDPIREESRAQLAHLLRFKRPPIRYGRSFL